MKNIYKNFKIVSPFVIYCFIMFLFYFDNLFKINNYEDFFEILGMALFAGFFEELIFRHWLQKGISKKLENKNIKSFYAIFIVATLFGLLHMTNLIGDETKTFYQVLMQSLSALGGGLLLGSIYYKTNNYLVVSTIHALYDFVVLLSSKYCVTCSVNNTLELVLQIFFNFLITIFLLKDDIFFNKRTHTDKIVKKFQYIYYILYVLILISMILLWRK